MSSEYENSCMEPVTGCILEEGIIHADEPLFSLHAGYANRYPAPDPFPNSFLDPLTNEIVTNGWIYAEQRLTP